MNTEQKVQEYLYPSGAVLFNPTTIGYYRKKPFLVQAVQFTKENRNEVHAFVTNHPAATFDETGQPALYVQTPNGAALCRISDWVVKTEDGVFYVVPTTTFFANYDFV